MNIELIYCQQTHTYIHIRIHKPPSRNTDQIDCNRRCDLLFEIIESINYYFSIIKIIEIMITDIFTKSQSIKLFKKCPVLLISHWY
jgi:hypothetical protein